MSLELHDEAPSHVEVFGLFGFRGHSHNELNAHAEAEDVDWLSKHAVIHAFSFSDQHFRDDAMVEDGMCRLGVWLMLPVDHEAVAMALLVHNHLRGR